MGRRLKLQKRGKGSPKYKATHKAKAKVKYKSVSLDESILLKAQVVDFISDPIRSAPLAKIQYYDGTLGYIIGAEGMFTGQKIELGAKARHDVGCTLPLSKIKSGTQIYNIENSFGDGGKFVRASGQSGVLINQKEDKVIVKLPSGKLKNFPLSARATIGVVAGGGRSEKPFVKAGNKFYAMKAKGQPYPRVRGVAMNPVDHPFGGSQHHVGHSKSTKRDKPAGRKVGSIASKRTGRRKK